MNINQLVANLTPEIYDNLKQAVELGKWPDGAPLNEAQKQHTLQLVMAYQSKVLQSTEHFSVGADGNIVNRNKEELRRQFSQPSLPDDSDIARFKHNDL